jgi:ABC-type cobalamin/Fe3+-siderophores transport system ATPase subunit
MRSPYQPWWQWELNAEDRHYVEVSIAQVRLTALRHRWGEELSGGERQRAFLALALAQNPKILLLDEPTTFLDMRYQLDLLELLKELNQGRRLFVITVLQEINLAARYSDRKSSIPKKLSVIKSLFDIGSWWIVSFLIKHPARILLKIAMGTHSQLFGRECHNFVIQLQAIA